MVLRVIGCTPSARNPFFYNINKIEQGEAELVAVRNIRSAEFGVMYRTLMGREALAIRTEKPSVHLALSGDEGETLTDEQAVELLDRCLEPLDIANQPYFIVRHDDTKHVHFHVVSTKIKEDGRSILWNGIGKRLILELMKYQEVYGYKAGKKLHAAKLHEVNVEKKGTKADILCEFNAALSTRAFHSREEFIADMEARAVRMTIFVSKHTGREMIRCKKLDEKGSVKTRPVYLKGDDVFRLDNAVARNNCPEEKKMPEVASRIGSGEQKKDVIAAKKDFVKGVFPNAEINWSGIPVALEGRDVAVFYANDKRYAMMTVGGEDVISRYPIPFGTRPQLSEITWRDGAGEMLAYTGQDLVPLRNQIPEDGLYIPEKGYEGVKLPPGFRIEEHDGSVFLIMPSGKKKCFDDDLNRSGFYVRLKNGKYDVITGHQHDNLERHKKITGLASKMSKTKTTKHRY